MDEELQYRWSPPDEKDEYLWLSPEGEAIYCKHEVTKAFEILRDRYKIPIESLLCGCDLRKPLLNYGWMCYRHDEVLGRGWMIKESRRPLHRFFSMYGMIPTQAQKEKILKLFGREFDDYWVTWEAVGMS